MMLLIYCVVVTDFIINYIPTMLVDHNSFGIPPRIATLKIKPLKWTDFKGTPPADSPFVAHIYWSVNYEFGNYSEGTQPKLRVWVQVRPKSWTVKEQAKLLRHEYGHYLIGCLCALAFLKRATYELTKQQKYNYSDSYRQILSQCLKEYCALEKLYDEESSHNLNREGQLEWQLKLQEMFLEFYQFFQTKRKQAKRNAAQSNTRLRHHQKVNKIFKIDDEKPSSRHRHRQFSIKSIRRDTKERTRQIQDELPLVLRNRMSIKCEKKTTIGSQIRLYRKIQNTALNSCQISVPKDSLNTRSHTTQRMIR